MNIAVQSVQKEKGWNEERIIADFCRINALPEPAGEKPQKSEERKPQRTHVRSLGVLTADHLNRDKPLLLEERFLPAKIFLFPDVLPVLSSDPEAFAASCSLRAAFLPAVASISLMRLSWLTSLAPGS